MVKKKFDKQDKHAPEISQKHGNISITANLPDLHTGKYDTNAPEGEFPSILNQQIPKEILDKIPDEAKKRLEQIKGIIDKFQKRALEKFEDYVLGICLLPPPKEEKNKEAIHVLVLMDDTDSKKMSKGELKDKLHGIISQMAEDIDKNLAIETILLSEVWQSCYDCKYDILQMIAISAPVFDKGMLAAIKITEIHKSMVLKKFEKYIVAYVLAGSLVQGKATSKSDIDVFIVIDDTDVKKMTRAELKDKLRAIIIDMGFQAGEITGIQNKINIQVYILTDFWDNIKEANPIIFTFLRDGIPLYDRGIFMPWKQLLRMGKIRPSSESIDMFMSSGDQMLQRIQYKIKEIAMEDIFYSVLTPSQAAIMMWGLPPPTPKETPQVMNDIFVKANKLLEEEYVKILETAIKVRKDLEHGDKKTITGHDLDKYIENADRYIKRLGKLFKEIQKIKEEEIVLQTYENTVTCIRDVLKLEGIQRVKDKEIIDIFESEVIARGIIPEKYLRQLKDIAKGKEKYDKETLTPSETANVIKDGKEFLRYMIEHIQRKRGRELERTKIRVKHGSKFGEVILLDRIAFIIHDIDDESKDISKADITDEGKLVNIQKSSMEELEKGLTAVEIPAKVFIKQPIFDDLKNLFGKDVEVSVNY